MTKSIIRIRPCHSTSVLYIGMSASFHSRHHLTIFIFAKKNNVSIFFFLVHTSVFYKIINDFLFDISRFAKVSVQTFFVLVFRWQYEWLSLWFWKFFFLHTILFFLFLQFIPLLLIGLWFFINQVRHRIDKTKVVEIF